MMSRITGLALAAGLLAAAMPARGGDDLAMLSVGEVETMLNAPDVKVIDANTEEVYAKAHLPGATWTDLSAVARALPQDKGTRLVFYCKNPH